VLEAASPLIHVLTRYTPVQSALLSCLDIKDIINLRKTNGRIRPLFDAHIRMQGNIKAALRNYFDSPVEFRNVQARTDTLIGADFAYSFMARILPANDSSGLALFVGQGEAQKELTNYLLKDGWKPRKPEAGAYGTPREVSIE
jgi:hypothetical protein